MLEKLLVAIDNSNLAEDIFQQALALSQLTHSRLLLLHVLSDEEIGYPDVHNLADHLSQWEASRQMGLEQLRSRQMAAIQAGINAEVTQTTGTSGRTICEIARQWNANAIIVGHRGLSGMQELVQGSVSNYLVHHAPCSVLTVLGQKPTSWQTIVVAIDGSQISQHAFDQALAIAQATGANLHLLHVLSVEDKGSPSILSLSQPDFERQWEAFTQPSREMLQSHQAIAAAAGVNTEIHQKLGSNPGRVICEICRNLSADLVVVGRRGLSGLSELLMGSVSNYVAHYANCAVLTVQRQTKATPKAPSENFLAGTL